jgi:hypothetical protein
MVLGAPQDGGGGFTLADAAPAILLQTGVIMLHSAADEQFKTAYVALDLLNRLQERSTHHQQQQESAAGGVGGAAPLTGLPNHLSPQSLAALAAGVEGHLVYQPLQISIAALQVQAINPQQAQQAQQSVTGAGRASLDGRPGSRFGSVGSELGGAGRGRVAPPRLVLHPMKAVASLKVHRIPEASGCVCAVEGVV